MTPSVLAAFLLPLVVSTMAVELLYFCSFEDIGLCGMEPREGGDFNWTRHTGRTPTTGTGPDSAADGRWYIYIESSHREPDNRETGDKAYIQTPTIEYAGEVCIRFQYHMYGQNIGRLVVYVDMGEENIATAYNKSENQNNMWHQVTVNVTFSTKSRVVFMAEVGDEYQGDIALDDLHIANGTCHVCQIANGGCEHICLPEDHISAICSCYDGYVKDDQKCIPAVSSPPSRTSRRPSIATKMYTLSATKAPDTSALTNTTSTVQRTTTRSQGPSKTTSTVTGQQTGVTTGLQDQLNGIYIALRRTVKS